MSRVLPQVRTLERPPRPAEKDRIWAGERVMVAVAIVSVTALVAIPVLMLVFTSVRGPRGYLPFEAASSFTLAHFVGTLQQGTLWRIVLDTGIYTAGTVGVALVLGFTLAWLVERTNVPFRSLIFAGVLIPFLLPPSSIIGTWMSLFYPRNGEVNLFLRQFLPHLQTGPFSPFNLPAMVLAQGLLLTPLVFLLLVATLRNVNGSLEEASRTSGAGTLQTVRRILIPLVLPGILTAVVLGVWFTLDSADVPLMMGAVSRVKLVSIRIAFTARGASGEFPDYGAAAAYAVLTMSVLYLLFTYYAHITRNASKYATITGHNPRAPRYKLGPWCIPALVLAATYFLGMWGLPVYGLIKGSIRGGITAFQGVLGDSRFWEAGVNSLTVAGTSATLGTAVVLLVSWVVVKSSSRFWKRPLDLIATTPLVVPALLAGVAFLLVYLFLDMIPLYGTLLGLILALSYRLAIPYRMTNAAMRQIGKDMEEASATSGATPFATFRHVLLPMLAPSIATAWTIFFIFGVREGILPQFVGLNIPTFGNLTSGFGSRNGDEVAAANVLMILVVLGILLSVRYALFRKTRLTG